MFQFPRFAFDPYVFRIKYLLLISANARSSVKTTSQLQISKVGFPIRKSADQSLFAAPHGLSQRTTSFIASQRQGIHRIPLRHLIALIVDARRGLQSQLKALKLGTDRKDQLTSWTHSSSLPPRCGRVPLRNDDCVTSSRFENNTRRTPEGIPSNLRGTSSTAGFSSIR